MHVLKYGFDVHFADFFSNHFSVSILASKPARRFLLNNLRFGQFGFAAGVDDFQLSPSPRINVAAFETNFGN
jgi:hypothetical protein